MNFRTWWMAWGDLVRKLVALVASFASMAGLLVAFLPKDLPSWAVPVLVLAMIAFIALVVLEFKDRRGRRVYAKDDTQGIKRYMHSWIEHGGRVAIWTRDMSSGSGPRDAQTADREGSAKRAHPMLARDQRACPGPFRGRRRGMRLWSGPASKRQRHGSRSSFSVAMAPGWRLGVLRVILMSSMNSAPVTTRRFIWLLIS